MSAPLLVVGVDGARGGWVAVAATPAGIVALRWFDAFADVTAEHASAAVVAVDMPIGLGVAGPRAADRAARAFVGPRRSSVFESPPRAAVGVATYAEALARTRAATGRGIAQQAFALLPRIAEVEAVAASDPRVVEIHPEVSFRAMAGRPLPTTKHSWGGHEDRRALIASVGLLPADTLDEAARRAAPDDVLDAAAAAWSALRVAAGEARSLPAPPERIDGRDVAIWY